MKGGRDETQQGSFLIDLLCPKLCTKSENPSHGSVRMLQVFSTNNG